MITNTRKIFYPSATDQYNRVLLEIVTFTGDIGNDFYFICQTNLCYLTQR